MSDRTDILKVFQVAAARFFALLEGLQEICHIPAQLANSSNGVERTGMVYLLSDRPIISRDLKNGQKVSLSIGFTTLLIVYLEHGYICGHILYYPCNSI